MAGKGYYNSDAQNAMRVARTETNIEHRRADHQRWQQLDLVLGIRVQLSKNHPETDICDTLQGDYPKDFVFDGWHPQCFCYATPILIEPSEMRKRNEALARGEEYTPKGTPITDLPKGFKDWVVDNQDKILQARVRGTEPYFIRNNIGRIDRILNPQNYRDVIEADFDDVDNTDIIQPSFVAAKTLEEVQERMHDVGIKEISLNEINVDEANYLLEVFEHANNEYGIELNKFIVAKNISNIKGYGIGKDSAGFYSHNSSTLLIDSKNFSQNHYQTITPYEEKIAKQCEIISRLQAQIAQSEAHLGRNKSTDKMLKQEIKSLNERIYNAEMKIRGYEDLIKRGYPELPNTFASTFEDIKSQVQAELWHEIGHYLDCRAGKTFNYDKLISEYSDASKDELFAEWFSYYKMNGEQGVPKQLLDIFKSQEKTKSVSTKGASQKGSSKAETRRVLNNVIDEDYIGRTKLSENQKKDNQEIAKRLGLNPNNIQPMTFIEADEGNSNIYRKDVNYDNNCVSCVVSNELRRRGLNVTAGVENKTLSENFIDCWQDDNGNTPTYLFDPKSIDYSSEKNVLSKLRAVMNVNGGRYIVGWDGKGIGRGHVLCAERVGSEIIFYDPQLGKNDCFWTLGEILNEFNPEGGLQIIRIDNLRVSNASAVLYQRL